MGDEEWQAGVRQVGSATQERKRSFGQSIARFLPFRMTWNGMRSTRVFIPALARVAGQRTGGAGLRRVFFAWPVAVASLYRWDGMKAAEQLPNAYMHISIHVCCVELELT